MSVRAPLGILEEVESCAAGLLDGARASIGTSGPTIHNRAPGDVADDREPAAIRRPCHPAGSVRHPGDLADGRAVDVRHDGRPSSRTRRHGDRTRSSCHPARGSGPLSVAGPTTEGTRHVRRRVDGVDVAVGRRVQDVPVGAGTERRRQRFRRPDHQDRGAERDDQAEDDQEPGHPLGTCAKRAVDCTGSHLSGLDHHGRCRVRVRPRQDLVEVGGHSRALPARRASRKRSGRIHRAVSCETALREVRPRSGIGVECRSHGPERSVEARFRRSERDPEHVGDFGQWKVEVVMKDDQGTSLRLETAEAAFELVAVADRRRHVADAGVSIGVSSTSTRWRRSRRASSIQAR